MNCNLLQQHDTFDVFTFIFHRDRIGNTKKMWPMDTNFLYV